MGTSGLVNGPTLEFLGLSPSQINEFFKKPTTIRFHVRGSVQSVSDGFVFHGMRLVSD